MYALNDFSSLAAEAYAINVPNTSLVKRLRLLADQLNPHQIATHLGMAISNAADSAYSLSCEESHYGSASPETVADHEYYHEQACAWSIIATERDLENIETLLEISHAFN